MVRRDERADPRERQSRARALVPVTERFGALVRYMPRRIALSSLRATPALRGSRRALIVGVEVLIGLAFVAIVLLGALHVRLLRGPIDVGFLVAPIEAAINEEISPLQVSIARAVVRQDSGAVGVSFRLEDIKVSEPDGAVVAVAPSAGIGLSGEALLSGRFAPSRIELIRPVLLVTYSERFGLTVATARSLAGIAEDRPAAASGADAASEAGTVAAEAATATPDETSPTRFPLARTAAEALASARRQASASAFLSSLVLSDAHLVFDHAGRRDIFPMPSFSLALDHRQKRSFIAGDGAIALKSGPAGFSFRIDESEKTQQIRLQVRLDDLVPKDLSQSLPEFKALSALGMAISGDLDLDLSHDGEVRNVEADLELGPGPVEIASLDMRPLTLTGGNLKLRYVGEDGRFEVLPSELRTGVSHTLASGTAVPRKVGVGLTLWDFKLAFRDTVLGDAETGLGPLGIDDWQVRGNFQPTSGLVTIDRMTIRDAGGGLDLTGRLSPTSGIKVEAVLGAMDVEVFKRLWPAALGPDARAWVARSITAGRIKQGALRLDLDSDRLAALSRNEPLTGEAVIAVLEAGDLAIDYAEGLPPLSAPEGTLRLEGTSLAVSIPAASAVLPSGRALTLGTATLAIPAILAETAAADIGFDVEGPVEAAAEFADLPAIARTTTSGLSPSDLTGKASGRIELRVPLLREVKMADLGMAGHLRLTDLHSERQFGPARLQGGTVDLTLADGGLEAKGDLLLNGVSAELSLVRRLDRTGADQPPLRIKAVLDASDRLQLGLSVNHFLRGDLPVTVTVGRGKDAAGGDWPPVHVEADLTGSELVLENMAWRKPPGEKAVLEFDVGEGRGEGTELRNFRILGDDIAIAGTAALGADRRLVSFNFPDFSFNVITHLNIAGELGADNIWNVNALGDSYDGRSLFRSLFSAGQLTDQALPTSTTASNGINLRASIRTIVGFSDTTLENVEVRMRRRDGRLTALDVNGMLDGRKPLVVKLTEGSKRVMIAETRDAGTAFRLIGVYGNIEGGLGQIRVDLDGGGAADKTGILYARDFLVLNDAVTTQVLSKAPDTVRNSQTRRSEQNQRTGLFFSHMRVPFSVGEGQLVLYDSFVNGPAIGATIRGKMDFGRSVVEMTGTYVPLYGVNSVLQGVPLFSEIFNGATGEGIFGINFRIVGPIANPQVEFIPMSALTPGIFRKIFDFSPPSLEISPADKAAEADPVPTVSSSSPPVTAEEADAPRTGETSIGTAMPPVTAIVPDSTKHDKGSSTKSGRSKAKAEDTVEGWQPRLRQ
ncbi:MAG: AsmA-like C-terminal region-containing protein [Hyphomicrobiaceae bacterium]